MIPVLERHRASAATTTLVYDTRTRTLEKHFLSLVGTIRNCAGGLTPWHTWVTCEETVQKAEKTYEQEHGYNFEVPVSATVGLTTPVPLKAMGRFNHEAIAVDSRSGIVYQTEDRNDGLLYRFIPEQRGELAKGGRLQALKNSRCERRGYPKLEKRHSTFFPLDIQSSPGRRSFGYCMGGY